MAALPAWAQVQFHGNGLVKNCIGPDATTNYVRVGDTATNNIQAINLDTFGHTIRINSIIDTVQHGDGNEVSPNLLAAPVDLVGLGSSTTVSYSFTVRPADLPLVGLGTLIDTANSTGTDLGTGLTVTASAEAPCVVYECASATECAPSANPCQAVECVDSDTCTIEDPTSSTGLRCVASRNECTTDSDCQADGVQGRCITSNLPDTTICRPSAGACDVEESCLANECPPDNFLPLTTICRESTGPCDPAESCTGDDPACPSDVGTPPTSVTIGDFIWLDSDGNGLQDVGEGGINGVRVNVYTCTQDNVPNAFLGQVTTQNVGGADGVYTFTYQTCNASEQLLIEVDASNFQPGGALEDLNETMTFVGGDTNSNQDSNCTNRTSDCRTIGANQSDLTVDCGYVTLTPTVTPTPTVTSTPATVTPTSTPIPQGGSCATDPSNCADGLFCVDGVCCDSACDGPLEQCNLVGREGICSPVTAPAPATSLSALITMILILAGIGGFAIKQMRSSE